MAGSQSKDHLFGKEMRLSDSNLPKGTSIEVLKHEKLFCGVASQNLTRQSESCKSEEETGNSLKMCVCNRQ